METSRAQEGPAAVEVWVASALRGESDALRSRLRDLAPFAPPEPMHGVSAQTGWLAGRRIGLLCFGVGAVAATVGARWLAAILSEKPSDVARPRVLLIGLAGGLDPALRPLARLGVRRVVAADPASSPCEVDSLIDLEPWGDASATCVTVPRILCTRADKRQAWALTQDAPGAVADLETASWCRELRSRLPDLALSCVRVVSDAADEELPVWMERCVDRRGALSPRRVALAAVARPFDWGRLSSLRRRLNDGSRVLADAVEAGL